MSCSYYRNCAAHVVWHFLLRQAIFGRVGFVLFTNYRQHSNKAVCRNVELSPHHQRYSARCGRLPLQMSWLNVVCLCFCARASVTTESPAKRLNQSRCRLCLWRQNRVGPTITWCHLANTIKRSETTAMRAVAAIITAASCLVTCVTGWEERDATYQHVA